MAAYIIGIKKVHDQAGTHHTTFRESRRMYMKILPCGFRQICLFGKVRVSGSVKWKGRYIESQLKWFEFFLVGKS